MAASRPTRHQPIAAATQFRYTTDDDTDIDRHSSSRGHTSRSTNSTPRRPSSLSPHPPLSPLYTPLHIQTNSPAASPSMSSLHQRRAQQSLSPHSSKPLSMASSLGRRAGVLSLGFTLLLVVVLAVGAVAVPYFYRSALPPSLLVSLIPFLSPPTPSIAIVSLLTTLPPPSHLTATDPPTRQAATITYTTLTSYLHLTAHPSHLLLLSASADVCRSLVLWGRQWAVFGLVVCRTVKAECVDDDHGDRGGGGGVVVGCVMGMVQEWLASVNVEYVAIVSPYVVLAPHLAATLASLTHSSHATHAHESAASASALVLTSHSTDVLLPPQLSEAAQQQTAYTAEQLYTALLGAASHAATPQPTALPLRSHIDLFVLPVALLRSVSFPPLLWSGVEAEDAVWRQWLLYHLYTSRHVQVVDATQPDYPLLFHLLPSPPPTPPSSTTATPLLTHNQHIANTHTHRLTWQLGHIHHAPYTIRGRCPAACRLVPSPSPSSQLLRILFHRTAASNHVMVVVVDGDGVEEDVEVFLCWARRVKFDAWLMAVRNAVTAERLKERGVIVVTFEGEEARQGSSAQEAGAARADVLFRLWLNELVARMLRYNVNVMLTNAAVIPLSAAPFSHLQPNTNHHLIASSSPTAASSTTSSVSPSLPAVIVLVNSAASVEHLEVESACLVDVMSRSSAPTEGGWMACSAKLSEGSVALSSDYYVTLDDYTSRRPSMHGHIPSLIHTTTSNTHIKHQLLTHWGLAPPSHTQCTTTPPHSHQPAEAGEGEEGAAVVLQVRVLTFDRTASLRRLLQSLSEVDWRWTAHSTAASAVSSIHIRFIISIDVPATTTATAAATTIATDWCTDTLQRWPSLSPFTMSCTALVQPRHLGLVGQWTEVEVGGSGVGSDEVLVVLEDDVVVTQVWFCVVMDQLVRFYYGLDPHARDPLLVSLALQHPSTIVGETDSQPYGTVQPAQVAVAHCLAAGSGRNGSSGEGVAEPPPRRCYFYYQLIGTWGAVFLPGQYAAFSRWLHASERNFSYLTGESSAGVPCVPSLLSNAWWQRRHDAVWSVWIIRYSRTNNAHLQPHSHAHLALISCSHC